ncbi:acyl carrier protein [Streptomyces sp. A3M-1-3]|uniref:acyl carrier protein n=1 Tax=Streptomyces sp. A3M-1-3 TaxID=2962044 RepID=UPI0020B8C80F|nr:acyl carrier protein [Streptomyces sp. A3M-1-3]MCP3821635.1 acyl carrier protein [Streptomyces sp. A3M-1-3]
MSSTKTDQDLLAAIASLLDEIAEIPADSVQADSRFKDDLDVDSLLMVELSAAVEDTFGVDIPDDEFGHIRTVGDLIACIRRSQS